MAAPADGIQDPYLVTINLTTSENFKLYIKDIIGLHDSNRYGLTRSKWTGFTGIGECCIHYWIKNISSNCHSQRWGTFTH